MAASAPRVAVIGVGLIGGSVALAARARIEAHVVGWDPLEGAAAVACTQSAGSIAEAVADAELVVIASPLDAIAGVIAEVVRYAPEHAVITDVGSAKQAIVASTDDVRFIGGHPLAGAEDSGVAHAREDLFAGATWYLTPTTGTEGVRLERLTRFITGIGARPQAIEPEKHDRLTAAVSHLPHVLANLLVEGAMAEPASAGPSFRDATRVAGANPSLWSAIYVANSDALIDEIDRIVARLGEVRGLVAAEDRAGLADWQQQAAASRARLDEALTGEEIEEVRVTVPNRPGVLAELALKLGGAGINIHDLSLAPSLDRSKGEVAVWVATGHVKKARRLMAEVVAG
ncbi:MAG TPA: prephenate dehydrogenase/arogenate dehydrogenase family protein [Baekduia sp.]|nr:prephenate dehydrogenase/arogenate dehydrogenase family protein [Baekduia sp.]